MVILTCVVTLARQRTHALMSTHLANVNATPLHSECFMPPKILRNPYTAKQIYDIMLSSVVT